jgi:transitional endoplasmic reticulum ATPase
LLLLLNSSTLFYISLVTGTGGGMERNSDGTSDKVLSTFLNEMDGVDASRSDGVIVLAATNRARTIDAALMRPGRFDKSIYVPLPDEEGRIELLKRFMSIDGMEKNDNNSALFNEVAKMCEGFTGAEIEGVCNEVKMAGMREILLVREGRKEESNSSIDDEIGKVDWKALLIEQASSVKPLSSRVDVNAAFGMR